MQISVRQDELAARGGLELPRDPAASELEFKQYRGIVAARETQATPSAAKPKPIGAFGVAKPAICVGASEAL